MPQLLLFAPFEKVIVSKADNAASLISSIENVGTVVPHGVEVPPNAMLPIRWFIAAMFRRLPEDAGKRYEQIVRIVLPDGKPRIVGNVEFEITGKIHRIVTEVEGLPVGQAGDCMLQLWLRDLSKDISPILVVEYPMGITHDAEEPEDASNSNS